MRQAWRRGCCWVLPAIALAGPAEAQRLQTVVVPADGGVVVAPRSAPPRLIARPAAPSSASRPMAIPLPPEEAEAPSAALLLVPLAAAALFAAGVAGGGGGGSAPAQTR